MDLLDKLWEIRQELYVMNGYFANFYDIYDMVARFLSTLKAMYTFSYQYSD